MTDPVYRTTGAWGAGQGYNLTAAQVDGNFYALALRLAALEDAPIEGVPPSNMTVNGSQWTIYYPDGLTFGPFTLPQGNFRPSIVGTLDVATDGTYVVSNSDFNRFWNYDSGADATIYLPATATADMEVSFCQEGNGALLFPDTTDVIVKGYGAGFLNQTGGVGSVVTVKFIEEGVWRLIGRVAEDVTA